MLYKGKKVPDKVERAIEFYLRYCSYRIVPKSTTHKKWVEAARILDEYFITPEDHENT
jgi:hypothetical protein